ncbi:hypothetical protein PFI31113_00592 [Pandoraea fibrosis]|uniref:HTH cro/C1-type domain-containing protein n=1 Tax=Pandoraea fibrosis TaxID=1891094 RepID=A0A5E4S4T7_9BURK|nr:hypothetical protein PFI31113_00592 [Pandoraea fibrosis]
MRSTKYLDELRQQKQFKNDTELAEYLGLKQNTISQYRHGKAFMSNDVCLRIADALLMDSPVPVIAAVDMDRAEKAGEHSLWEKFLPRMAGAAGALAVCVVTNFVTPSPAQASPVLNDRSNKCTLC